MIFEIYDKNTVKPVSEKQIEEISVKKGLTPSKNNQFAITQNGDIILTDNHGNYKLCEKDEFVPNCKSGYSHKYPDIEFCEKILFGTVKAQHPKLTPIIMHDVSVQMFPQTWASTAGGFEAPGMLAGCAMTTENTVVMKLTIWTGTLQDTVANDFYGVFFDGELAYIVTDPKEQFFTDLKNHDMKSKYEASKTQTVY